jgi:TolA-binding protein
MSHEEIVWRFVIQFFLVIVLVPVVAVMGSFTAGIIKMILSHQERKAKIRAEAGTRLGDSLRDEFESLRQEVSRLRDTATQYDISIQHTLEDLQRRVARVETMVRPPAAGASISEPAEESAQLRRS